MTTVLHKIKQLAKAGTLIVLLLLLSYGCNKTNGYRWVFYNETYCADSWKPSNNNETLKQNVVDYFHDQGITIYDLEIFSDMDVEPFSSCSNKTGRRIKAKIKKGDLEKIKTYGFYQ